MQKQHGITYQDRLSMADLEYLIKKANHLGTLEKRLVCITEESDDEGIHIFFIVEEILKNEDNS